MEPFGSSLALGELTVHEARGSVARHEAMAIDSIHIRALVAIEYRSSGSPSWTSSAARGGTV
jgi:hypothetical protein